MKAGLVAHYSWDVPGGVQEHIRDLAAASANASRNADAMPVGESPASRGLEHFHERPAEPGGNALGERGLFSVLLGDRPGERGLFRRAGGGVGGRDGDAGGTRRRWGTGNQAG